MRHGIRDEYALIAPPTHLYAHYRLDEAGIEVLADADGSYTKALGMNIVGEGWVNGRSKRYAMLVADGVVTELQVEESPGACALSSGDSLLDLI